MATPKSVWGLDMGSCALKAVKLANVDGEIQVEAFEIIEHPKILSQPDADRKELIHASLDEFLHRHNLLGSNVAVAVPGQASFTRIVKLPPVPEKEIPRIVQFEAEQQIPFKIEEVIWRWQTFQDIDSPEVELGIFAMKKSDIAETLSHFQAMDMQIDVVQMAPLALYNFMQYDEQTTKDGATLLVDVGADKTDLVVADGARIWTRTVQIGGNNFTEALVRAFKLSFPKAEKLKRTAASSKYARQIFQAMRPVFSDLAQEIQRSIGYYTSLHRESRFKKMLGLGNGFRLPGLQKFLEQNLNIPVARIDNYNRVVPGAGVNAPAFTENVLSFAVAYGLAVQGLGESTVTTNLLPSDVATRRAWQAKRPWFTSAAAAVLLSGFLWAYQQSADANLLQPTAALSEAENTVAQMERLNSRYNQVKSGGAQDVVPAQGVLQLMGYRSVWPTINATQASVFNQYFELQGTLSALGSTFNDQTKFEEQRQGLKNIPRAKRAIVFVDSMKSTFTQDIDAESRASAATPGAVPTPAAAAAAAAGTGTQGPRRGFVISFSGRTPLPRQEANKRLVFIRNNSKTVCAQMCNALSAADAPRGKPATGQPLIEIINVKYELKQGAGAEAMPAGGGGMGGGMGVPMGGGMGGGGMGVPGGMGAATGGGTTATGGDPLFPDEDISQDTSFELTWYVAVNGDGVSMPEEVPGGQQP